jgi:hypothetical protein
MRRAGKASKRSRHCYCLNTWGGAGASGAGGRGVCGCRCVRGRWGGGGAGLGGSGCALTTVVSGILQSVSQMS